MLMQLTAGTIFTQTTFGATGFSGTRAWDVNGSLSVHGSRTGNNEFLIDGAPSSGTGGGTGNWNYAPPVDAIEEFKIGTSAVDASYGRTSGGVINMTLRSGTNQLRGSGIVLHRGTWLDSNQIQNIRNNISNEGHKYYNAEGMVSGPIVSNRTFFMGGYQGFYENIPFPVTRTVPDRGAAARRLLADDHGQRHADHHLRPGDDGVQRELQLVHAPAVPGQHHPAGPVAPDREGAAAAHPAAERDAEQPRGIEQLHQLAEHRPLPLQLVPRRASITSSARTIGCRSATAATGASSTATRTRCRSRRSAATTTRRTATTTWSRLTTTTRSTRRRCGTRGSRGIGSTSRTTRSTATSTRSLPFTGAVSAHRAAVPADQPRRLRGHVPAHVPSARRTMPTRSTATSRRAMGKHFLKVGGEYRAYRVLPLRRGQLERHLRVQQRLHAARPADQHRRRVGQRRCDVPARPADQRQRRHRHAAHRAVPATTPSTFRTTGRSARG